MINSPQLLYVCDKEIGTVLINTNSIVYAYTLPPTTQTRKHPTPWNTLLLMSDGASLTIANTPQSLREQIVKHEKRNINNKETS